MVLLLETGDWICSVTVEYGDCGVVLLLEKGDLMCSVTYRVWRL